MTTLKSLADQLKAAYHMYISTATARSRMVVRGQERRPRFYELDGQRLGYLFRARELITLIAQERKNND